jgi:hypothetical protein
MDIRIKSSGDLYSSVQHPLTVRLLYEPGNPQRGPPGKPRKCEATTLIVPCKYHTGLDKEPFHRCHYQSILGVLNSQYLLEKIGMR